MKYGGGDMKILGVKEYIWSQKAIEKELQMGGLQAPSSMQWFYLNGLRKER